VDLAARWRELLRAEAAGYAEVAMANIKREFPADVHHTMTGPGDFPFRPRARTPVFYGSLDWHSCVEMHWLLVRLLRAIPESVPAARIRSTLRGQFSRVALEAEADYIAGPGRWGQRPYGWGWALALVYEAQSWDDPDGQKWAAAMTPLAEAITGCFLDWLPKATYPVRYGVTPTARSACPGRCRSPASRPRPGMRCCCPRSRIRRWTGTAATPCTRAGGSRPGTTSCHRP
jgi:hypothetical protein